MPHNQLCNVLDGIIELTKERDSNALELTLAETLFKLADVNNLTMHTAGNINRVKHAILNNEKLPEDEEINQDIIDALSDCLESAKVSSIIHKRKKFTLFPLLCSKKQPLAVILVEQTNNNSENNLIIQILNIYHNFLSLMNENERDTLTGLLNRKTFELKISHTIFTQQQKRITCIEEPTFLAIFDIDHFKKVNDNHGHLIGDEVLLMFSHLMGKNFRDTDLLFRFGGEEFVGIFQCPNNEAITNLLNRFRGVVQDHAFPQVGKVTVSCGFTKIDEDDISSNIIDRADIALYHAKNNGRNQVCQHEILVALGLLEEDISIGGEIELF